MESEPRRGITLVCAEAGAGKTSMLCEWLQQSPLSSAWISLDSGDYLRLSCLYLVTAIRTLFPGACQTVPDHLAEPETNPDRLARLLAGGDRRASGPVRPGP